MSLPSDSLTSPHTNEDYQYTAVRRIMERYFLALDLRDFSSMQDCFEEGVHATYGGHALASGRQAVVEYVERALANATSTRHLLTGLHVQAGGPNLLVARTLALAYVLTQDTLGGTTPGLHIRGIQYRDVLRLDCAQWRIRERQHIVDWTTQMGADVPGSGVDRFVLAGVANRPTHSVEESNASERKPGASRPG